MQSHYQRVVGRACTRASESLLQNAVEGVTHDGQLHNHEKISPKFLGSFYFFDGINLNECLKIACEATPLQLATHSCLRVVQRGRSILAVGALSLRLTAIIDDKDQNRKPSSPFG